MRRLVGPRVRVETRHENGSITYSSQPKKTFLKGHVVSEPGSLVTMNTDGGLVGYFVRKHGNLAHPPLPSPKMRAIDLKFVLELLHDLRKK